MSIFQPSLPARARGPNIPKVTTPMKKAIVELAISGLPSGIIAKKLKQDFGVEITSATVRFWRIKLGDRIRKQVDGILDLAYATQPLASLETRLKIYSKNIRDAKNDPPEVRGRIINDALRNAADDIRNVEITRLKAEELALKRDAGRDGSNSYVEFIETIERRLVISRENEIVNDRLAKLAGWDDEDAPNQ